MKLSGPDNTPALDEIEGYPSDDEIQAGLKAGKEKVHLAWERELERSRELYKSGGWDAERVWFD